MKKHEFWFGMCCLIAWLQMLLGHPLWAIFSILFIIFIGILSIINLLIGD